jgi:hypothetical protein
LTLQWVNPVYRDRGEPRSGSCYLLHKGKHRPIVHDLADSVPLDGLSPEEMADVFNRTEILYCYDLYTMYARYAALCGCVPVVVPDPDLTRDQWVMRPEDRYGVAYGEDDIPWALETRGALADHLRGLRAHEDAMLKRFVAKCRAHFGEKAACPDRGS